MGTKKKRTKTFGSYTTELDTDVIGTWTRTYLVQVIVEIFLFDKNYNL